MVWCGTHEFHWILVMIQYCHMLSFICMCCHMWCLGSDVANIRTTAKKTADGQHYIVNGTKVSNIHDVWYMYRYVTSCID